MSKKKLKMTDGDIEGLVRQLVIRQGLKPKTIQYQWSAKIIIRSIKIRRAIKKTMGEKEYSKLSPNDENNIIDFLLARYPIEGLSKLGDKEKRELSEIAIGDKEKHTLLDVLKIMAKGKARKQLEHVKF